MSEPKHPSWAKPVSSSTITTTFGAPARNGRPARGARDNAVVSPIEVADAFAELVSVTFSPSMNLELPGFGNVRGA